MDWTIIAKGKVTDNRDNPLYGAVVTVKVTWTFTDGTHTQNGPFTFPSGTDGVWIGSIGSGDQTKMIASAYVLVESVEKEGYTLDNESAGRTTTNGGTADCGPQIMLKNP